MTWGSFEKILRVLFIVSIPVTLALFNTMHDLYPDFKPMDGFAEKFRVAPCTPVPMMKIVWVTMYVGMIISYIIAVGWGPQTKGLFPWGYHIGRFPLAYTTTLWLLLFAFQKFVAMTIVVVFSVFGFTLGFILVTINRATYKPQPNSGNLMRLYDLAVVEGLAICSNWYAHSLVVFGTIAIAYKEGPTDVAIPTEVCDPAGDCAYYLLPIYVVYVLGWILCDIVLWPHVTNRVKSMYPAILYVCFGVLWFSTTRRETGSLLPIVTEPGLLVHKTYVALAFVTLLAWVFRGNAHTSTDVKKAK